MYKSILSGRQITTAIILAVLSIQWCSSYASPAAAATTQEGALSDPTWRVRRKVGKYAGPGPLEYMKQLRESLSTSEGSPNDIEHIPTSVLCLMDQDVINNVHHKKTPNRNCKLEQSFLFNITQLTSYNDTYLPLSEAFLRTYLQPIKQNLQRRNANEVKVEVSIYTKIVNSDNGSSCSGAALALREEMTIYADEEDQWTEWNITDGVKECWENKMEDGDTLEAIVQFRLKDESCKPGHKKVPLRIVDPAIIPTTNKIRRQRHWDLQPVMILYLDDSNEREKLKSSLGEDNDINNNIVDLTIGSGGGDNEDQGRGKRSSNDENACKIHNLTVYFQQIQLNHIAIPQSYEAGQCSGDCSIAVQHHNTFTNHGKILASMYYSYNKDRDNYQGTIPVAPCCVASEYNPLTVLEWATQTTIIMKPYPRMIVKKCECRA
ncbi:PREDICTED: bone morphogenetic protein 6-like [Amphimedon queenslandica]|uniref:TGF-beta family profile domain-containing protein n=1 Tax=Amphimedon queenslandica TaxID=400682 RepID=A0A1X7VB63_AMPQE|nr:PREDICTED: bone morphogenetic protein 6-like [Amphimedon queenslandica]|eukprot:XP_011402652.1 PREDICTED: bone morphogenetic protein 6-like [Amphimedon queenslandica]